MQLEAISATNFKGKTFTYQLGTGTAIIGPNFAGKTAVLNAIVLLLKGCIPQVGKTAKATWELSSGKDMTVTGEFEDGHLTRTFWLDSGTVKSSRTFHGIAADDLIDIPLLDADEYFGMTDSQRTNYVFARIKLPEAFTAEGIIAELEQISFEEEHTESVQKAKAQQVKVAAVYFHNQTIQDALEAAVNGFKEKFTAWNRRAKETQGAVKTLTELKLREKEISTDSLGALKLEIDAAQIALQGVVETKGRLTAQRDELARNKHAITVLEQRLAAPQIDYAAQIVKIDAYIKEQTEGITPEDESLPHWKAAAQKQSTRVFELTGSVRHFEKLRDEAKVSIEDLAHLKSCPMCKAKGKGWKANVEKERTASFEAAELQLTETRAELDAAKKDAATAAELTAKGEAVASENLVRHRAIQDAQRNREEAVRNKATATARRIEWENDLKQLKGVIVPASDTTLDDIEEDRVRAAGKLAKLRERQEAAQALQHDLKRASEAQLEHLDAAANVAVIKRIQSVLSDKRDAIVAEVFNTLLVTANKICGSIFQTPLTLYDGTIGRWSHESKFIPHRTFSGTEKALTYIAIATALSSQAPIRLAILDEFGRLDEGNQYDVLENLTKAVKEGVIDQFIVVGTLIHKDWTDDFGVQVIQMKP